MGPFCPRVTSGSQKTGCANRGLHVWATGEITWSAALNQSQGGIYICGVMEDRLRHSGEALPPAHPRRTATVTGPPPYAHPTLALV